MLYIINPRKKTSKMLQDMISQFTHESHKIIQDELVDLNNKKILLAIDVDETLSDIGMLKFMKKLIKKDKNAFVDSHCGIICASTSELGTKDTCQDIIFLANSMGAIFIGHPMVEATKDLINFSTWQKVLSIPLRDILLERCKNLNERLRKFEFKKYEELDITVLYSTPNKISNSLDLWKMVKSNFDSAINIKEILIENGSIQDCKGCGYKVCTHYGKDNKCFYGGPMISDVLPAIEKSNAIVWICPNYNDAIAANLTAVMNRLTVLYNKKPFHDKVIFGIVVSGNSGGDSVAKQLIGALNLNKGFMLPPKAFLLATANDPKSIFNYKDVDKLAKEFSEEIKRIIDK